MSQAADTVRRNDIRMAECLGTLTEAQWSRPSLCTEWTNHEVLAHLVVGYSAGPASALKATLHHRGSFDLANAGMARTLAAHRGSQALLDDFASLTQRARGIGRVFPRRLLLGDHVIHELDITFAVGVESTIPAEILAAVLDTEVRIPNPFVPASSLARGLTLIATDAIWSHRADGPTVEGRAAHLASTLAGRPWALQYLTGTGVSVLETRLASRQRL